MVAPHVPVPQSLHVSPAFGPLERAVLRSLAGAPVGDAEPELLRIWRGQPRGRSRWLPCEVGCCLMPAPGPVGDLRATWLRFLVREVLAPRSVGALARCAELGLGQVHRLRGTVAVRAPGECGHLITAAGHRVSDERAGAPTPDGRPVRDRPVPRPISRPISPPIPRPVRGPVSSEPPPAPA